MNTTKQRSTRYSHPLPHSLTVTSALFATILSLSSADASAQQPRAEQPPAGQDRSSGAWQMPSSTAQPQYARAPQRANPNPADDPYAHLEPYPTPPPSAVGATPVAQAPEPVADAAEDDAPSAPFFDLALATYVPLSLGAQASLELPGRLLVQLDVGWMPPAYGSAINGIVQAAGGYDTAVGAIVDSALEDAIVVRVSGGWRPFPSAGFEILGGYTHVSLSGSVSPQAVADVVGGDFAGQVTSQLLTSDVGVSSQLHNFHVGLGWRWVAWDHLVIRASLGYTQTVGSSTSVESPDSPEAAALANPIIDTEMSKVYEEYVKLPVIGLSGGYRF